MEVIIGVGCRWRHEGLVDLHGKVVDAEVAVEADLEDEGVEDGVVHGGDVEMEHLEMEALEKGDDPDGRGAPRERAKKHVGAGDPSLHVGHGGVAAGGELCYQLQLLLIFVLGGDGG
ncbi:hypothetical protein OsJ_19786 [Oryza sativa Japonica Group]|uniref:Uncharacterized protein n=1 Tax=Oryza sativa subsp. japonica TaxID=39947 RepID=B9FJ17_ORYSJ|nr:hypothetical protein OsJ_19786 [Oryza sativa Japonica Group]